MRFTWLLICFLIFSVPALTPQQLGLFYEEEHGSPEGFRSDEDPAPSDAYTWEQTTDAPSFFGRSAYGAIGDYVYIFCSQNATSLAIAYHIPTKTWLNSTPATAPGFNISSTVANGKLYKMGGSGTATNTTFEVFTPTGDGTGTWATLTAGPSQVRGPEGSIVWDGGNYIYASAANSSSPPVGYFHRYNITTNAWEEMAAPPIGRRYAGMATLGRYIYRVGGLGETGGDFTLCYKYDTATNTWSAIAPFPEAANFTKWSVAASDSFVYVVGGGGGFSGYSILMKVYVYNPETNTWAIDSDLPAVRGLPVGTYIPGFRKLFFGGGNDGTSGTSFQVHCWEGIGSGEIPVELTSFTVRFDNGAAKMNWTTATETNNMSYNIERSADKINWLTAGSVNGSGTTTQQNNYSFTDITPFTGISYYRLKQTDYDGSYSFSEIVEAENDGITEFRLEQNYPNPFNPETTIEFALAEKSEMQLTVYNITGKKVAVLQSGVKDAGNYRVRFDGSGLPSGIYICRLTAGGYSAQQKITLLK
ncbi:MAG: T9SS type A sorting domain-containing protein [Ignavibacteriaceae bacterium]|nr:T9SS type A sorting domain-containing protein [Ignavibacteriaceae bacterium]